MHHSRNGRRWNRLKTAVSRIGSIFKKEPLDCDYVYEILGSTFGFFDCEKHVASLIKCQEKLNGEMGAWSETFGFSRGNEAPLVTAEAVLALLPYSQRNDAYDAIKRACRYLVNSQNSDGGWKDLTDHSLVDATGCIVVALSEARKKSILEVQVEVFENAVDFLISQQNPDGGWCTVKGENSKMHYTYFALWGLACSKGILQKEEQIDAAIEKGIDWIKQNGDKNTGKGLSLKVGDAPSPVATALAVLCFLNIDEKDRIKQEWLDFLKTSKIDGGWEEPSDASLVYGSRRVYDFRVIPWIVESLVRMGEPLDSQVIKDALHTLKRCELPTGGFVSDPGKADPVVWHTAWSLRMMQYLRQELRGNLRLYVDNSIKSSMEMSRKIENYEKELNPEKRLMRAFAFFTTAFISTVTYLLYLLTNSQYGKWFWYSFFVVSTTIVTILVADYLNRRRKLNDFTALLLATLLAAVTSLLWILA
jgi:hypothetical protein